jgi:uncharacterized cupin superfamily protein
MARTTATDTGTRRPRSATGSEPRSSAAACTSSRPARRPGPYHYELGCEEWLIVVSGRPTLRSPDGEQQLEPGDVAVFPEGPAGAHKLVNGSTEPARLLIMSSKAPLAVVHYPDSGKLGIWTQAGGYQAMLPRADPRLLGRRGLR